MRWNGVCNFAAFSNPAIIGALRLMAPRTYAQFPDYPAGREHRKAWEEAMTYLGLHHFGAIRADAELISVAGGHELVTYHLTNEVRWVFSTDIYGTGDFVGNEAVADMLREPEKFVHGGIDAWRPGRLVVEYMNAHALRAETETFDAAYSLSSIEHMGGLPGAKKAIAEMGRVVRPGGVVAVVTECCVNGAPPLETPGFSIFTPEQFEDMATFCPYLEAVEPFSIADADTDERLILELPEEIRRGQQGLGNSVPHVLLREQGRVFTSGFLFFRRLG